MTSRAKLRDDLVLVEQTYRGEQSYIVKDPQSRKYFRFRPVEIMVMQALDGQHTAAEASAALAEEGLKVSPAGVEKFAGKLTAMGLCERTLRERSVLLMERLRAERRRRLNRSVFKGDLMRLRWSVGDPDKLFDRWLPRLRFFFSRAFLTASVALFAIYLLVLALKWSEFSRALADLYTFNVGAGTLAVFWLTGTVIIVIHELGHGFTCKYFGGQVHEIGAMLIYFEPAFFCNVNDAWTFPELRARLWVTAAGSWIQLVVASLGAIVWWAAAPGTVASDVAFAAVLIGGITTVFMNANPLIPLDGYYALSDYLEVPNLRQRAFAQLTWLIKTRAFRLDLPAPPADEREQRIFLIYGALATAYISLILGFFAASAYGWLSRGLGVVGVLIFLVGLIATLRDPVREWFGTAVLAVRQQREGPEFGEAGPALTHRRRCGGSPGSSPALADYPHRAFRSRAGALDTAHGAGQRHRSEGAGGGGNPSGRGRTAAQHPEPRAGAGAGGEPARQRLPGRAIGSIPGTGQLPRGSSDRCEPLGRGGQARRAAEPGRGASHPGPGRRHRGHPQAGGACRPLGVGRRGGSPAGPVGLRGDPDRPERRRRDARPGGVESSLVARGDL